MATRPDPRQQRGPVGVERGEVIASGKVGVGHGGTVRGKRHSSSKPPRRRSAACRRRKRRSAPASAPPYRDGLPPGGAPMPTDLFARIGALDWPCLEQQLAERGHALVEALLDPDTCAALAALYPRTTLFRSRIDMARHGFGQGEYQYFAYPLPEPVATLRNAFYPPLAVIANRWHAALGLPLRYPAALADWLARCHAAGQHRPTPLLLQYGEGDYNCLHQDLYGEHVFPLQVAILLSRPGADFDGGEFVLTEQRPRRQSRAAVVPLRQGDAGIFAVHHRPAQGGRGIHRATLRHGVSEVRCGRRHTLGLIFHDAS
ncbi:hypothetical protein YWS52_32640 [Chitiniphilus shinanonensis]